MGDGPVGVRLHARIGQWTWGAAVRTGLLRPPSRDTSGHAKGLRAALASGADERVAGRINAVAVEADAAEAAGDLDAGVDFTAGAPVSDPALGARSAANAEAEIGLADAVEADLVKLA